jgi:nitroimidazol reductase NimA-like FMN-containing flavoprotein (pyridoxamine 5'-phosphate oxidase superfamily)
MEIDRNGMEVLPRERALQLLRSTPIGRVVVTMDALPAAFPVNFVMLGDDVVFVTSPGTKLEAAVRNAVVAFQADAFDVIGHTGWSVLVQGRAAEVTDPVETAAVEHAGLRAWLPQSPTSMVRISSEIVSGRQISLAASAEYRRPA